MQGGGGCTAGPGAHTNPHLERDMKSMDFSSSKARGGAIASYGNDEQAGTCLRFCRCRCVSNTSSTQGPLMACSSVTRAIIVTDVCSSKRASNPSSIFFHTVSLEAQKLNRLPHEDLERAGCPVARNSCATTKRSARNRLRSQEYEQ